MPVSKLPCSQHIAEPIVLHSKTGSFALQKSLFWKPKTVVLKNECDAFEKK